MKCNACRRIKQEEGARGVILLLKAERIIVLGRCQELGRRLRRRTSAYYYSL
jgi:hypothetical protein